MSKTYSKKWLFINEFLIFSTAYLRILGSPGPLPSKIQSGFNSNAASAEVLAGTRYS